MNFMTVAENIWIRREPTNSIGLIDHAEMADRTRTLFKQLKSISIRWRMFIH